MVSVREFHLAEQQTMEKIIALSRVMKRSPNLYDGMLIDTPNILRKDHLFRSLNKLYQHSPTYKSDIAHLVSVSLRVPYINTASYYDTLVIAALFHDYYEDNLNTDPELDSLISSHPYLKECLMLLTRSDEISYFDYIDVQVIDTALRTKSIASVSALIIKLLDNLENQSICFESLANPPNHYNNHKRSTSLLHRYRKAFFKLNEALTTLYTELSNDGIYQGG